MKSFSRTQSVLALGVLLGMLSAVVVNVQAARQTCQASCPAGSFQTGGACPVVHGNCSRRCTGSISCFVLASSSTITVPCQCQ